MVKYISLSNCTGRTKNFYQLLRNNLYEKNYKDAPAIKNLYVQIAMASMALACIYWELRWLL